MGITTRDIPIYVPLLLLLSLLADPETLAKTIPQVFSKHRDVRIESRKSGSQAGLCACRAGVASLFVPYILLALYIYIYIYR